MCIKRASATYNIITGYWYGPEYNVRLFYLVKCIVIDWLLKSLLFLKHFLHKITILFQALFQP